MIGEHMKHSFNLKKYYKKAFYEDERGYWTKERRAWANCYKEKCDEGKGPQDAWSSCMEEYQDANSKADWALSYVSINEKVPASRPDLKTPAAEKIIK